MHPFRKTMAAVFSALVLAVLGLLPAGVTPASAAGAAHHAPNDPPSPAPHSSHLVPGVTGSAAAKLLTPAQRDDYMKQHYAHLKQSTSASPAPVHQFWAIYPSGADTPTATDAHHSVTPSLRTSNSGDVVYAPTLYPAGNACIENTTAYENNQAVIWAWDWCNSYTVGKYTAMDANFQATYTKNGSYEVQISKTNTSTNQWTMWLFNYSTNQWDRYFDSAGYDKNNGTQSPNVGGWDAFEVYSANNPSTNQPYICADTANDSFSATQIWQLVNGSWKAPDNSDSTADANGAIFGCTHLNAKVTTANSAWTVSNP